MLAVATSLYKYTSKRSVSEGDTETFLTGFKFRGIAGRLSLAHGVKVALKANVVFRLSNIRRPVRDLEKHPPRLGIGVLVGRKYTPALERTYASNDGLEDLKTRLRETEARFTVYGVLFLVYFLHHYTTILEYHIYFVSSSLMYIYLYNYLLSISWQFFRKTDDFAYMRVVVAGF